MADFRNLHIDQLATRKAMQFFQTDDRFLGVKQVPIIKVSDPSGILSVLDPDDLNRDEVQQRTRQAQAEKAGFGYLDVLYKTDERSLEYDVNAAQAAGASPGRNPEDVIPFALAYKANLHTEVRLVSDVMTAAKWYRVVTGAASDSTDTGTAMPRKYWSDPTNDPISAIKLEIDIFILRTGMIPTGLRLGRTLFTAIVSNPLVRAQAVVAVGGQSTISAYAPWATVDQLSMLLGLKVTVGSAIRNTQVQGLPATNGFIVSPKDALLTFDAPSTVIDAETPTAFARVVWTGISADGFQVRRFPRPEVGAGGSMASVLDIYNGFVIINNKLGTYFTGMMP